MQKLPELGEKDRHHRPHPSIIVSDRKSRKGAPPPRALLWTLADRWPRLCACSSFLPHENVGCPILVSKPVLGFSVSEQGWDFDESSVELQLSFHASFKAEPDYNGP